MRARLFDAVLLVLGVVVACGKSNDMAPSPLAPPHVRTVIDAALVPTSALTLAPALNPPQNLPSATSSRARFDEFWRAFHTAVKASDTEAIASMTRFPFETRGTDDGDPVRRHDRKSFDAMIGKLLSQESGYVQGPDTLRELIISRSTPTDREYAGGSEAGIGDLRFAEQNQQWRLTRAYTDMFQK